MAAQGVTLVFSDRYPGRYAITVLAGAVEHAGLPGVTVRFERSLAGLTSAVTEATQRGHRIVVAWSFYSPSFPECAEELAALRRDAPPFLALAGGVHATAEPLETLGAGFDLLCVGEGEVALVELLRRVRDGELPESAPGFARLVEGKVTQTPRPPRLEALDAFPPFAPGLRRFGSIELTRGCIYACRFCQTPFFSKARFRHRSVDDVVRWARVLREHRKRDLRFISPTSLSYGSQDESVNLAAVEELLARTSEAVGPEGRVYFGTFPSEVRPEHVTPAALRLIRRYCANDNLVIGGQSGSARVLEASKRGHDVEAIVAAVRVAVAEGFLANVDFILGLPGEAPEDVRATVTLMQQLAGLGARVHGHTFMPLPGTPFRNAPPGAVDDATRVDLDRLASQQQLYGHWKAQLRTARELARRRDANAQR